MARTSEWKTAGMKKKLWREGPEGGSRPRSRTEAGFNSQGDKLLGFSNEAVVFAVMDLGSGWRDWSTKAKSRKSDKRQRVFELTSDDDHNGVSGGCTRRPHPPRCHKRPTFQDPESAQSLRSAGTEEGAVR